MTISKDFKDSSHYISNSSNSMIYTMVQARRNTFGRSQHFKGSVKLNDALEMFGFVPSDGDENIICKDVSYTDNYDTPNLIDFICE